MIATDLRRMAGEACIRRRTAAASNQTINFRSAALVPIDLVRVGLVRCSRRARAEDAQAGARPQLGYRPSASRASPNESSCRLLLRIRVARRSVEPRAIDGRHEGRTGWEEP